MNTNQEAKAPQPTGHLNQEELKQRNWQQKQRSLESVKRGLALGLTDLRGYESDWNSQPWPALQPRQPRTAKKRMTWTEQRASLAEALQELAEIEADAREDNLPVPSQLAQENARQILKELHRFHPRHYGVYNFDDGVAIDTRGRNHSICVICCHSDGSVSAYVTVDNESRRVRYQSAKRLPDAFLREAIRDLERTEQESAAHQSSPQLQVATPA